MSVFLYALRGDTRPGYISRGGGRGGGEGGEGGDLDRAPLHPAGSLARVFWGL